ncbi:MAG: 6,7-dimethyl-8-ribityllumazine synthase [Hyphomicrobiales bacterium]
MTSPNILLVEAPYYSEVSEELAAGAIAALEEAGASFERVAVPGALEIPGVIVLAEEAGRFDGYVALGCVIRGETSHYDIVAGESARALMALTLDGLAIGNGILTCENREQAMVRARVADKNKGADAANAALAMISLAGEFAIDG